MNAVAVAQAAGVANTRPTEAQKEAGNYRKGHLKLHGLDISIENPYGSQRQGVSADGKPWAVAVPYHYGYVRRTTGADGDNIDVAINPFHPDVPKVHVVDQIYADTGNFDEHKIFLGYSHAGEARTAHEAGFSDGLGHVRQMAVTETTLPWFKFWLRRGNTKKPFSEWMKKPKLVKSDLGLADYILVKNDWSEDDHPRDDSGKFSNRAGGVRLLYDEQNGKCAYCGKGMTLKLGKSGTATREHLIRPAHGGSNIPNNIVATHYSCNQKRGGKAIPPPLHPSVPGIAKQRDLVDSFRSLVKNRPNVQQITDWLIGRALKKNAIELAENILLKGRVINQRDVAEEHEETLSRGIQSYLNWLSGKPAELVAKTTNEYDPKLSADALPMGEMDSELTRATRHLRYAFIRGGEVAHPLNQKRLSKLSNIDVSFDDSAPQVAETLDNYHFGLVRSINDSQRDTIKQVVSQGVMQGQPPLVIAARIRNAIGLTPSQAMQVLNFRNELENLNKPDNLANALNRQLRDQRFDRTITNAAASGQNLSSDQIDNIVNAYQKKYIAYRANTIARTESLRAANMGSMAAAQQIADQMGPDTIVTKKWLATMDNRTRETHRELNGQAVDGIDTPFDTSSGNQINYPHDPEAPPEETINCRCTLGFEYNQPDGTQDNNADNSNEADNGS